MANLIILTELVNPANLVTVACLANAAFLVNLNLVELTNLAGWSSLSELTGSAYWADGRSDQPNQPRLIAAVTSLISLIRHGAPLTPEVPCFGMNGHQVGAVKL